MQKCATKFSTWQELLTFTGRKVYFSHNNKGEHSVFMDALHESRRDDDVFVDKEKKLPDFKLDTLSVQMPSIILRLFPSYKVGLEPGNSS